MKGQQLWDELERRGRQKFSLDDAWLLCGVDLKDDDIASVEFRRKGRRGGWLRGIENSRKGLLIWTDLNDRLDAKR